jgi:hypothetical protein
VGSRGLETQTGHGLRFSGGVGRVGAMLSGKAPTHPLPLPFFRDASNYAREGLGSEMVGAWGVFAYSIMPKLKDPKTSAREALVIVQWPVDGGGDAIQRIALKPIP